MRVFKKRDKWWIDFRDPEGVRRRKSVGTSKREATAALERVKESILSGTYYDDHKEVEKREAGDVTLGELWKEFRDGRTGVSENTRRTETVIVEKVILPFFGASTLLKALEPTHFSKFVRWRAESGVRRDRGCSKSTIVRELACLRSMWNWGLDFLSNGIPICSVPKNKKLNLPSRLPSRIDFFSVEELNAILAEAETSSPNRILPAAALGAFAGLRLGEMTALRWESVDLDSGVIRVRNYRDKREEVRTKSQKDRVVPIRDRLARILRELQDRHLSEGGLPELVLPTNRAGRAMASFKTAWFNLLKRAGIRRLTIHCLRHTAASHLVMSGVPLVSVKEFLGHSSIEMTMRYAHLAPEHLNHEMERVEKWHQEGTKPKTAKKQR